MIDFDFVHLEVIDFLVFIDLSIAIDSDGVIVRFFLCVLDTRDKC